MRNNLSRMFDNRQVLDEMDIRADGIKMSALEFNQGASRLEKMARARRMRMYLLLAAMIAGFVLFVYCFL